MAIKISITGAEDFGEKIKQEAMKAAKKHLEGRATVLQNVLDEVHRSAAGQDVAKVEVLVRSKLKAKGMDLPEKNVKAYAKTIAAGNPIKVETKIV